MNRQHWTQRAPGNARRTNSKQNDKEYWLSKTPIERLEVVEFLRQTNYGYDPVTSRLQRFFEVAELF